MPPIDSERNHDELALAQEGLALMKRAIVQLLERTASGLRNFEIADRLNLRSDYEGGSKDYLTWSVLGILLNEGKVKRDDKRYVVVRPTPDSR